MLNNSLVLAGGYSLNKVLDSVEIFDFSTHVWTNASIMPQGVGNAAFCAYQNELYVSCGQYSEHGVYTSDKIQKYSMSNDQWTIVTRYVSPGNNKF